jgi:hypothetical protein
MEGVVSRRVWFLREILTLAINIHAAHINMIHTFMYWAQIS